MHKPSVCERGAHSNFVHKSSRDQRQQPEVANQPVHIVRMVDKLPQLDGWTREIG